MDIVFVGNPFLNTEDEHLGWNLINKRFSLDEDGDVWLVSVGKVKNISELEKDSYRECRINDDFHIGDMVYCNTRKPFIGYVEFARTCNLTTEIYVINARSKVGMFLTLPMLQKVEIINSVWELPTDKPSAKNFKIDSVLSSHNGEEPTIIVENLKEDKNISHNIFCGTPGGMYEAFYSLQENYGFNFVYQEKECVKLCKNELNKLCKTLGLQVLLNNTDDKKRWQIKDINNKIFDFAMYLSSIGYCY